MINSIQFTGKGKNDYIMKHRIVSELREGKTMEDWNKVKNNRRYSKDNNNEDFFVEVDKGLLNDRANKCLLNRVFNFDRHKINIIFGPNASGKSTILKAIAAKCMCGNSTYNDGFTSFNRFHPVDYPWDRDDLNKCLDDLIYKKSGNEIIIDWDGSPVYYHNYENKTNTGTFDDWENNIIGGFAENMYYEMQKNSLSDGKKSLFLFSKLFDIAKKGYSFYEIEKSFNDSINNVNRTWQECLGTNFNYIKSFQNNNNDHITFLLDEIDKSLDLNNQIAIFEEFLPKLYEINNDQIIMISHSPIVLNSKICSPDCYNIISLDENYTNYVKKVFGFE